MNPIVERIEEELRLCYPQIWKTSSPTKKAIVISKHFKREWAEHWHWLQNQKAEAKRIVVAEQMKKEIAAAKKKLAAKTRFKYWDHIVMTASGTFADASLEYCQEAHPDKTYEEIQEIHCGGAWQLTDSQEEDCMREALYSHWCHIASKHEDSIKFYNKAIKHWKKYWK